MADPQLHSHQQEQHDQLLSPEQLRAFAEDGYLVLPGWWDADTVRTLLDALRALVAAVDTDTLSFFSTEEQTRTSDEYFLTSGDKARAFFEPHAFSPSPSGPVLNTDKGSAINKLGHNLHELVPAFRAVSLEDARIASVLRQLGYEAPCVPQSMAILKSARVGGAVNPHVDGAFLYTVPQTCLGFWWPLEDCTIDNGCLWAVPGSHAGGVHRRFKRDAAGTGTVFDPPHAAAFDLTGAVPLETRAGSLVLLHHALVHYSGENTSAASRHAYSMHVVEGGKGVVYPPDNWLQRGGGNPFPRVFG